MKREPSANSEGLHAPIGYPVEAWTAGVCHDCLEPYIRGDQIVTDCLGRWLHLYCDDRALNKRIGRPTDVN